MKTQASRFSQRPVRLSLAALGILLAAVLSTGAFAPTAQAAFFSLPPLYENPVDGTLVHQQHLAVDHSTGNVLVADVVGDDIDVYAPGGALLTSFGAGELVDPHGVAVDQRSGAVYVSDAGNRRIARYTVTPGDPPSYALDGGFTSPVEGSGAGEVGSFDAALAIDGAADTLFVADRGNRRIARYTLAGAYDNLAFDGADSDEGAFTIPLDVAVDSTGDILVVDATDEISNGLGDSRVLRFSSTGAYEARIGAGLVRPATVAVRPADDEVFVSWNQDSVNSSAMPTVDRFDSSGTPLESLPLASQTIYSVVTGMAFDDGAGGALYVGTDVDRSSYNGAYGLVSVQAFSPPLPPGISGESAVEIRRTTATLTAGLGTNGADTTWWFEYGIGDYAQRTASVVQPTANGTSIVSASLTGLQPNALYQYRLVADNGIGAAVTGPGGQFTTVPPQPLAALGAATDVGLDAATVSGTVDMMGDAGSYAFSLAEVGGPQRFSGPLGELPGAFGAVPVSARFTGLKPATTYVVGVYAHTGGGLAMAEPVSFTTAGTPSRELLPRAPDWSATPYGCAAPKLTGVRGTARAGQPVTLTGSDLGVYGIVNFGDEQAEVRAYAADAVTVLVPEGASGRTAVTLDCGRGANALTVQVAGGGRGGGSGLEVSGFSVRGASATVTVLAPGRGTVRASGRGLRRGSARASRGGSVKVRVRLSRAGRRALARARGGRMRVTATVRFTPARGSGGRASSAKVMLVFRR